MGSHVFSCSLRNAKLKKIYSDGVDYSGPIGSCKHPLDVDFMYKKYSERIFSEKTHRKKLNFSERCYIVREIAITDNDNLHGKPHPLEFRTAAL